MEAKYRYYLLIVLALATASCGQIENEPQGPTKEDTTQPLGTVIYSDDSTEWRVWVPYGDVYVYDEYHVDSPYHIPTHEEAYTLKTITYGPSGQRYLTDDGYTFGMPSASVTKAGQKTKYYVLALWRRPYIIHQYF